MASADIKDLDIKEHIDTWLILTDIISDQFARQVYLVLISITRNNVGRSESLLTVGANLLFGSQNASWDSAIEWVHGGRCSNCGGSSGTLLVLLLIAFDESITLDLAPVLDAACLELVLTGLDGTTGVSNVNVAGFNASFGFSCAMAEGYGGKGENASDEDRWVDHFERMSVRV